MSEPVRGNNESDRIPNEFARELDRQVSAVAGGGRRPVEGGDVESNRARPGTEVVVNYSTLQIARESSKAVRSSQIRSRMLTVTTPGMTPTGQFPGFC